MSRILSSQALHSAWARLKTLCARQTAHEGDARAHAEAFHCLNDLPYPRAELHPRTQPTFDLLFNKLLHYAKSDAERDHSLRIGLFGGYGQGKSSVALALKEKLEQQGVSVWRLDFSDYSPDELAYGFDALLAGYVPMRVLGRLGGCLLLFGAVYWLLHQSLRPVFIVAGVVFGWRVFKPFELGVRRWFSYEWDFKKLWNACKRKNCDVLIIDDLDRASVEQQRSLLRSIYKYSNRMHIAVLVCMDETALLQSPASPDEPAEFLRKIIHFELRLPHREQSDIALMVLEAAHLAAERNAVNGAGRYAGDPEFLFALVRVSSLLPNTSSRRAKRLLNDTLGRTAQLLATLRAHRRQQEVWLFTADVAALLRLAALFELVPEIRNDLTNLAECLEDNRSDTWRTYLRTLGVSKAEANASEPAVQTSTRFFALTRGLQPVSSWRALLSTGSVRPRDEAPQAGALLTTAANMNDAGKLCFLKHGQNLRRALNAIAYGLDENPLYGLQNQLQELEQRHMQSFVLNWQPGFAWLVIEALLPALSNPETRWRLYRYLKRTEMAQAGGDTRLGLNDEEIKLAFYRTWAADEEVFKLMPAVEQRALLRELSGLTSAFRMIGLLPSDAIDLHWRVYAILFPQSGVRDDARVRRWLLSAGPESDGQMLESPGPSSGGALLARCWPAPGVAKDAAEFCRYMQTECRKIRSYADRFGWQEFPDAVKQEPTFRTRAKRKIL